MFTRFGSAASRVLRLAEQECRNRNHYYVGVEHVLFALSAEPDEATASYLHGCGVKPDALHEAVRRALGTGEERNWQGIILTPRMKTVVAMAEQAAGKGAVEPLHLLRAIVDEDGSDSAELIAQLAQRSEARS